MTKNRIKSMTTSERLLWLAALIAGKLSKTFDQLAVSDCTVALGLRVTGTNGRLRPASMLTDTSSSDDKAAFAKKYGVTESEANALYYGCYSEIDGRMRDKTAATANSAAAALRALARQYARKGN
jgi:hypothetical protein